MWMVELNAENWNTETREADSSLHGAHSWLFQYSYFLQIVHTICTTKETMEETHNAFGWKEMLCFWTSRSNPSAMGSKPDPTWPWTFQGKDIQGNIQGNLFQGLTSTSIFCPSVKGNV